ncbi:MAG: MlaD family protein, partial [Candidatus Omnitrophica bacterium]|nr:MlaD family protein [Candidatus Omnitrophota bacterium]
MIFGKTKMELKVGVFVFIGMVILVIFLLSIGGFKTWSSGYRIKVKFGFVNGIKMGAPVRFAGVDVGEVKKIH